MARRTRREDRRGVNGLPAALFFLGFVAAGAGFILWSKLSGLPAVAVTAVPVALMFGYAVALILLPLRDEQGGDNLYYMGFLFTLTSLAVSLWQFEVDGATEEIVRNFGVAIASTIAGIGLRIFMNQVRRDPEEVERSSRLDLADAARRVRRELDATVVELNQFRRATQQAGEEAMTDAEERARAAGLGIVEEIHKLAGLTVALTEAVSRLTDRLAALAPPEAASGGDDREAGR